jgi:hypothetical protein
VSDPLRFRSQLLEDQFFGPDVHHLVRQIVLDAAEHALEEHGWLFEITSAVRTAVEDALLGGSGIHVTGRAVDVGARSIPEPLISAVTEWVNTRWQYDAQRPRLVVCYSKPHGSGRHLHFQVHERTRPRPGRNEEA